MALENRMPDIHICGTCRSEFNDVYWFLQHKKMCGLPTSERLVISELSQASNYSKPGDGQQWPSVDLQTESHQMTDSHFSNSSQMADVAFLELAHLPPTNNEFETDIAIQKLGKKDFNQFATNADSVSSAANSEMTSRASLVHALSKMPAEHTENASSCMKQLSNGDSIGFTTDTVSCEKYFYKCKNISEVPKIKMELPKDNLARYVVSPTSLATYIRNKNQIVAVEGHLESDISAGNLCSQTHHQHDNQTQPTSNRNLKVDTTSFSGTNESSFICFDITELSRLAFAERIHVPLNVQQTVTDLGCVPEFCHDSSNSTPCPEDLEVGAISASVLAEKNRLEEKTTELHMFPASKQASSSKEHQQESSACSSSSALDGSLMEEVETLSGSFRQHTASAPVNTLPKDIKASNRGQKKSVSRHRRVLGEKRGRLPGVSDDILSSPVKHGARTNSICVDMNTSRNPGSQLSDTSKPIDHNPLPSASRTSEAKNQNPASFKAVFTSPSRAGYRLASVHTGVNQPSNVSSLDQSQHKKQIHSKGSTGLDTKPVEYKNISAATYLDDKHRSKCGSQVPNLLPEKETGSLTTTQTAVNHLTVSVNLGHQPKISQASSNQQKSALTSSQSLLQIIGSGGNKSQVCLSNGLVAVMSTEKSGRKECRGNASGDSNMEILKENREPVEVRCAELTTSASIIHSPVKLDTSLTHGPAKLDTSVTHGPGRHDPVTSQPGEVLAYYGSESNLELTLLTPDTYSQQALSPLGVNVCSVMIYTNNDGSFFILPRVYNPNVSQDSTDPEEGLSSLRYNEKEVELALSKNSADVAEFQEMGILHDHGASVILAKSYDQKLVQHKVSSSASSVVLTQSSSISDSAEVSQVHTEMQAADSNSLSLPQYVYVQSVNTSQSDYHHQLLQAHLLPDVDGKIMTENPETSCLLASPEAIIQAYTSPKVVICEEQRPQTLSLSGVHDNTEVGSETENQLAKPTKAVGQYMSGEFRCAENLNKDVTKDVSRSQTLIDLQLCHVMPLAEGSKTRSFFCKFDGCRYNTSQYKDFQRHYRQHTGERPFKCPDCGKTFARSDKLKLHQRQHAGVKPFQCKLCNYAASESGSLKKHMRIHNDERPFKCQICSYASRNSSHLIVHLRTHTGDAPFHCTKCPAKFKISSDIKRHMRIHTGEKPFSCDKCAYKCSNRGNLKIHLKLNHSKEKEINCPACPFVTSSRRRLREHDKTHSVAMIKCPDCEYACATEGQLRSHAVIHSTEKPFKCGYCPYSCRQKGNMKKHVQNIHLSLQGPVTSRLSRNTSQLLNAAPKDKKLSNNGSSQVHAERRKGNILLLAVEKQSTHKKHKGAGCQRLHVCRQCGCSFVRHDSLRCHMKQHSKLKSQNPLNATKSQVQLPQSETGLESMMLANISFNTADNSSNIQISASTAATHGDSRTLLQTLSHNSTATSMLNLSSHALADRTTNSYSNSVLHNSQSAPVSLNIPALSDLQKETRPPYAALTSNSQSDLCKNTTQKEHARSAKSNQKHSVDPDSSSTPTKFTTNNLSAASNQHYKNRLKLGEDNHISFQPSLAKRVSKPTNSSIHKCQKVQKLLPLATIEDKPSQTPATSQVSQRPQTLFMQPNFMSPDTLKQVLGVFNPDAAISSKGNTFLVGQETANSLVDRYYNIQLVTELDKANAADNGKEHTDLQHLQVGDMHIQMERPAHIEIVMPGTAATESDQLTDASIDSLVSAQHILLQVQDCITLPLASL